MSRGRARDPARSGPCRRSRGPCARAGSASGANPWSTSPDDSARVSLSPPARVGNHRRSIFAIGLALLEELQPLPSAVAVVLFVARRFEGTLLPFDGLLELALLGEGGGEGRHVRRYAQLSQIAGRRGDLDRQGAIAELGVGAGGQQPG